MTSLRVPALLVCLSFLSPLPETLMAADVPHPQLPAGAGAIDADAPKAFATTASGLQYRVLRKGAGANPKATSNVKVNYHGWLDGGKVFDSSYDRGEPAQFPLSGVIKGWTEGVPLMQVGAKYRFWIPSDLAYGPSGRPPVIPPHSVLIFEVELLDVIGGEADAGDEPAPELKLKKKVDK